MIDLAPVFAETEPLILITVATAKGTSAAFNSANFSKYSLDILIANHFFVKTVKNSKTVPLSA
jgi:hypothetical protein